MCVCAKKKLFVFNNKKRCENTTKLQNVVTYDNVVFLKIRYPQFMGCEIMLFALLWQRDDMIHLVTLYKLRYKYSTLKRIHTSYARFLLLIDTIPTLIIVYLYHCLHLIIKISKYNYKICSTENNKVTMFSELTIRSESMTWFTQNSPLPEVYILIKTWLDVSTRKWGFELRSFEFHCREV